MRDASRRGAARDQDAGKRSNSLPSPADRRAAGELWRAGWGGGGGAVPQAQRRHRPPARVIGPASGRSFRRRQPKTPIGGSREDKTKWQRPEGGVEFSSQVPHPPTCLPPIFRIPQYLNYPSLSSVSGSGCTGRLEVSGSRDPPSIA